MLGIKVKSNVGHLIISIRKYKFICTLAQFSLLDSYSHIDPSPQIFSHNREINEFIKSGSLQSAHQLFDEMPMRDIVTWNLLISGYKRHGLPLQALNLYREMVFLGVKESPSTFSSVLSVCSNSGLYFEGVQVHCRVISLGFSRNLYVGSAIVDLYMQMGFVDVGLGLLYEMPERNCAVWNLVLRGFCEAGMWDELLRLYLEMRFDGVEPNEVSVCYLIRGCGQGRFVLEGEQLHCYSLKVGFLESNLFVANALLDFYSACGSLIDARKCFEVIHDEDVISWNSIVSVNADNGLLTDAIECLSRMQIWGKSPSSHSFLALLNLCSESENLSLGRQIHCCALKWGFDFWNVYIQSALIDMYGKCYEIECSVNVYESCPERTRGCCNALMTSFLHCGVNEGTVELFESMVHEGIGIDEVSLSTMLKATSASSFASQRSCKLLHCCSIKTGFESDIAVSCSLINAYAKLGQIEASHNVFESLSLPNVVSYTALINGYARNGLGEKCLNLLELMLQEGLKPDRVTFLCALTGCNHSGLVKEGRAVFDTMKKTYQINPDRQHCACIVDLLGRAGMLHEAEELLEQSSVNGDFVIWSSLLGSCRVYKNEAVGRRVARRLMDLEPRDPAVYVQVSGFYFEIGDYESYMYYKEVAVATNISREIGRSLIEVNG